MVDVSQSIAAVGALGTAAYGLVDTSKFVRGGVSNHGFEFVEGLLAVLFPDKTVRDCGLSIDDLTETLLANWLNGVALDDQKAKAKTLIKLMLGKNTAAAFASATGVDPDCLIAIANYTANSTMPLTDQQKDALGRFDVALTAMLDQSYQRADQKYRNSAKTWAMVVAVILAICGNFILLNQRTSAVHTGITEYLFSLDFWTALLVGLVATPLAPIAKDLSGALNSAMQAMQTVKK